MSLTVITGGEIGDEAKGKMGHRHQSPDKCDIGISALGGNNAGHMVEWREGDAIRKHTLSLLPAAALYDGVGVVLGRGKLIDPNALIEELQGVDDKFHTDPLNRLTIAGGAHMIFAGHKEADAVLESWREKAIGTTGNGIGPAAAIKDLRVGVRMESLTLPEDQLMAKYHELQKYFRKLFGITLDSTAADKEVAMLKNAREVLGEKVEKNMMGFWRKAFNEKKRIVLEGCQGSDLNIDSDRYPNVTAGAVTAVGHMQGAQLSPARVTEQIVCIKAYKTSVGAGGWRTQLPSTDAARIQKRGHEFGSKTGRGRDISWPDLPHLVDTLEAEKLVREVQIKISMMKLDVLDEEELLRLCVDVDKDGRPIYQDFKGWQSPTAGMTRYEDLPERAREYVEAVDSYMERQDMDARVTFIGTGAATEDTIVR